MKIMSLCMSMLLMLGIIQLNAQKGPCASLVNVQQNCEPNGTVTLSFQISNNSGCLASAVSIVADEFLGQSFIANIPPQTVSSTIFTIPGVTPGTSFCFDIILHGTLGRDGSECCSVNVCVETDCCDLPGCDCDLEAEVERETCGPNGTASVIISGGTPPYSGQGVQSPPGQFSLSGLSSGAHTFTYTDSEGCEIDATVNIANELVATASYPTGCDQPIVQVSGGTAPYDGPGSQISVSSFGHSLPPGTHTLTYTDSNGCEASVVVQVVSGALIAEIISIFKPSNNCASDGCVNIRVFGGIAPYDGPGDNPFGNIFTLCDLSVGDYNFEYTDSQGCSAYVSFTIDPYPGSDCAGFTETKNKYFLTPTYWDTTYYSDITATLTASFDAYDVQDHLLIEVNGTAIVNELIGTGDLWDECEKLEQAKVFTFCVECGDEIFVSVDGSICPDSQTAWMLDLSCQEDCGGGGSITSQISNTRNNSDMIYPRYFERLGLNSLPHVDIFPNPVTDVINITNSNSKITYESARIMSSTGQVVYNKRISSLDQLQIDASTFAQGIYILELTDDYGQRMVKKFIKQ